jgi:hypothetical protein
LLRETRQAHLDRVSLVSDTSLRRYLRLHYSSEVFCPQLVRELWLQVAATDPDAAVRGFAAEYAEILSGSGKSFLWDEEQHPEASRELMVGEAASALGWEKPAAPALLRLIDKIGDPSPVRRMKSALNLQPPVRAAWCMAGHARRPSSRRTRRAPSGSDDDPEPPGGLEPSPAVLYAASASFATRASFDRTATGVSAWLQAWGDELAGVLA